METHKDTPASNGLTLKRVAIDTYHENVAYLHRDCAVYRAEGFQALSKVEIRANGKRILASLNVVDDASIVGCNELGVSEDAFARLEVADGHPASVSQAEPPESIPALFRKINGERLTREDFHAIVRDIAELRYSKIELTAFVVASNRSELDREEVYFLSEAMVASAGADRTQVQLQARTQQADAAQRSASAAQQAATAAEVQAATAERNAAAAQRSTEMARSESAQAQQQTQLAMERTRQLEARLKELNAQQTPRGLVVTLGDVLFDVNRAVLKPGGLRKVDQLVAVLKEFPQRNVLVEGFTDSTGADSYNLVLSGQRADAVRTALLRQGIDSARVTARGYGEASPVSDNASAAGRQMNRRVEIVLSDDSGRMLAR